VSRGVRGNALVKVSERLTKKRLYLFGVKGNVCCHALVVGGLGVGPLVAPIELVQLRIRVLKLKSQLIACADVAIHRVTHLGLFVLEAIGQRDASPVFFTGGRVFNRLYIRLPLSRMGAAQRPAPTRRERRPSFCN
jgi:hypothetical protein